jgi:hypothetical protein
MKSQARTIGPAAHATAPGLDGIAASETNDRPLPGVEFEELVGAASADAGRVSRWQVILLALTAGVLCLGFGGRWIGGSTSGRNADPVTVAVTSGRPTAVPIETPAGSRPMGVSTRALSPHLPIGFSVAYPGSASTSADRRLAVAGFVTRRETIRLRILDPDGSMVAAAAVGSRLVSVGVDTAVSLWAFEAIVTLRMPTRLSGPDADELEVRWTSDSGSGVVCLIPLAIPTAPTGWAPTLESLDAFARCQ